MKIRSELKVRRPDGTIEMVNIHKHFQFLTQRTFDMAHGKILAQIKKATREAGRGEVLDWEWEKIDDRSDADKAWDAVSSAYGQAERESTAEDNIKRDRLTVAADKLAAEWAEDYPQAAADRNAKADRKAAARIREIRSRPGYKAAMQGCD